jgi:ribosomal protein L7/L12
MTPLRKAVYLRQKWSALARQITQLSAQYYVECSRAMHDLCEDPMKARCMWAAELAGVGRLDAIRIVRDTYKCGLREARDFVNEINKEPKQ